MSGAHGRRAAAGASRPRTGPRWRALPTGREWLLLLGVVGWSLALLAGVVAWMAGARVVGGVVLLLVLAVFAGHLVVGGRRDRATRRRAESLAEWAVANGWTCHQRDLGEGAHALARRWTGEPMTAHGSAVEVLRGEVVGHPVVSFTFLGRGAAGAEPPRWHVVAVDLPAPVTDLDLRAGRGTVVSDLLAAPPLQGREVRVEGGAVLAWEPGPTDVDRVLPLAEALGALVDAVPGSGPPADPSGPVA